MAGFAESIFGAGWNELRRSLFIARLLLSSVMIFTSACVTSIELNISSPYFNAYAGSKLILLRAIEIPANSASVYIQDGEVKPYKLIDRYRAYCNFEVNTRSETKQTIHQDEFQVLRYRRDFEHVSSGAIQTVSSFGMDGGFGDAMATIYSSELFLRSDKQPDVLRMTCSHWDDPNSGEYLTVSQIRQTLNGLFQLQLPKKVSSRQAT